jgi:coenzyme F420 hydrogenase subunit beta
MGVMDKQNRNKDLDGKSHKRSFKDLEADVINKGLCTVCGTCAGICPKKSLTMAIGNIESDEPVPTLTGECKPCGLCYKVCAGRDVPLADLDNFVFGRRRDHENEHFGIYRDCLRGFGKGRLRSTTSSGGVTSAVLKYALSEKIIDAAIVAVRHPKYPFRATTGIITTPQEVDFAVRSVMEAVPVNDALHEAVVARGHRRLGLVGLPCQVHSIRKLQMEERPKSIANSIVFTLGLFCNSTTYYIGVEHLLKEVGGIRSFKDIMGLDYRAGAWPGTMMVMMRDGKIHTVATKKEYGTFLSAANYRRDRCMVCIDFSAELADISVGDIFNVSFSDPRWCATMVRTEIGETLIKGAKDLNYIYAEPHNVDLLAGSGYGWEMSKHASMYRWIQRKKCGWPVPDFQYPPYIAIVNRNPT